jgi:hypothetical protein
MKFSILVAIFLTLSGVSRADSLGSELEPSIFELDSARHTAIAIDIEAMVLAKMWDFSAPCDTNQSLVIELGPESQCVVRELEKFDADKTKTWSTVEITTFVKEVLKMPLFPGTIAKGIISRFDLNKNEILDSDEAEDMVEGLKKEKST